MNYYKQLTREQIDAEEEYFQKIDKCFKKMLNNFPVVNLPKKEFALHTEKDEVIEAYYKLLRHERHRTH